MLAEGHAQVDAEHASSGHPPIWREVYNLMRCTSPPTCYTGTSLGDQHSVPLLHGQIFS